MYVHMYFSDQFQLTVVEILNNKDGGKKNIGQNIIFVRCNPDVGYRCVMRWGSTSMSLLKGTQPSMGYCFSVQLSVSITPHPATAALCFYQSAYVPVLIKYVSTSEMHLTMIFLW